MFIQSEAIIKTKILIKTQMLMKTKMLIKTKILMKTKMLKQTSLNKYLFVASCNQLNSFIGTDLSWALGFRCLQVLYPE